MRRMACFCAGRGSRPGGGGPHLSRAQQSLGPRLLTMARRGWLWEVPRGCQPRRPVLATEKQQAESQEHFKK